MDVSSSSSGGHPPSSFQSELQRQIDTWREAFSQCVCKPSRGRIHTLRSLTMRLSVALKHELLEKDPDSAAVHAFRRWNKMGKKLRRALQPVRDADVYLAKLDRLRSPREESGDAQLSPRCLREIDQLESRLKQQRKRGIDRLIAVTDAHGKRINRRSSELQEALGRHSSHRESTAPAALRIFAGLASEFPALDRTNLHAYRKRIKSALYLAEISAADDPLAGHLAALFKKINLAAGVWHDWQTLALEAGCVLSSHGKKIDLIRLLETRSEKALQKVLELCQRTREQFLKDADEVLPSPHR